MRIIISIPAGAIESAIKVVVLIHIIQISIPAGAIESVNWKNIVPKLISFQYQHVQLKAAGQELDVKKAYISIPAGAIERIQNLAGYERPVRISIPADAIERQLSRTF